MSVFRAAVKIVISPSGKHVKSLFGLTKQTKSKTKPSDEFLISSGQKGPFIGRYLVQDITEQFRSSSSEGLSHSDDSSDALEPVEYPVPEFNQEPMIRRDGHLNKYLQTVCSDVISRIKVSQPFNLQRTSFESVEEFLDYHVRNPGMCELFASHSNR